MALLQRAREATWSAGAKVGEKRFMFLMEEAGEISEKPQSPAAGHARCQDALRLRNADLREGKCKSALQSGLPAEGGFSVCAPAFLCPGPNADFIFAFYELERGNSFPWL